MNISNFFKFQLAILLSLLLFSCNQNNTIVELKIQNPDERWIYLKKRTPSGLVGIDSVSLAGKHEHLFKLKIESAGYFVLYADEHDMLNLILHPGEKIQLGINAKDFLSSAVVKGSEDNIELFNLVHANKSIRKEITKLSNIHSDSAHSPNIIKIREELDSIYFFILDSFKLSMENYILKNRNSLPVLYVLNQYITPKTRLFNIPEDVDLFLKVDSALLKHYPESELVLELNKLLKDYFNETSGSQINSNKLAVGDIAPLFSMPGIANDSVRLDKFKGKLVLLSFWASWNKPSRNENQNLIDLHKRYSKNGFDILQISLDKNKEAWINAVKNDKLIWSNACDLMFWNSKLVPLYNVSKLPSNYIIDKDGVIIEKDLFGDTLYMFLDVYFKQQKK